MGISQSLPMTGYIKMIDIWMIFTISYPFVVITVHCLQMVSVEAIDMESKGELSKEREVTFYVLYLKGTKYSHLTEDPNIGH